MGPNHGSDSLVHDDLRRGVADREEVVAIVPGSGNWELRCGAGCLSHWRPAISPLRSTQIDGSCPDLVVNHICPCVSVGRSVVRLF